MNLTSLSAVRLRPSRLCLLLAGGFLANLSLGAPVLETTAVQTQPDPSAPVITFLKAGSEPVPATEPGAGAPAGWMAVDLPGPFEGYVQNKDLTKSLDVKPGSQIHLAPKLEAGVLATASKGDKISITGLRGKWTQVRLDKTLVAYIHPGPLPSSPSANPGTDAAVAAMMPPPGPVDLATAPPPVPGHAAATGANDATGGLPRVLEGKFASSRRLFKPRRPYDWEIDDDSGTRIAYLDLSKLLLTEQIASYASRNVQVFGAVTPVPESRDLVIAVESLQLK